MRRIRLTVAYDGASYVGWQAQPNGTSVEEVLNAALTRLLKEDVRVIGASRTDSGVHADGNIAVFDTESRIPGDKFKFALNEFLPKDIVIQDSDEVPPDWHPRKINSVKTYEYRILNRVLPLPKERDYSYFFYYALDHDKTDRAARVLVGEHDFKSFCSIRTSIEDTVRRIYSAEVTREGDIITFRISGSGFLYNMVRIIVGTLVKIGAGIWPEDCMQEILEARDRSKAGPKAPPQGLTLKSIVEEQSLAPCVDEDNPHWSYVLYQDRIPEERTAFLVLRAAEDRDYDRTLLRLTKQLSRNGALYIFVRDLSERLKEGQREDYFTYHELGEDVPAGERLAALYGEAAAAFAPGVFPTPGRWFVTADMRKVAAFAGNGALPEEPEDPMTDMD